MTERRQRVRANIARAMANVQTFANQGNWTYPAVFPLPDKSPAEAERCEQMVHALAEACGYPVEWFDQSEIPASGNWDGETIALTTGHPWATTLRVLAHELGHAVSGTDDDHWLEEDLGVTEIVAEVFCQELCRRLGLDTSPMSDPYIRGWRPDAALVVERYRERVLAWVDEMEGRMVDEAGRRFLAFAEKHPPITMLCFTHGPGCPDRFDPVEALRTELHRPGVLDFLGRDLNALFQLPKGGAIVGALIPMVFEVERVLTDDEVVRLLTAWSLSLERAPAMPTLSVQTSVILRWVFFPPAPMSEAATDRWLTFLVRTLGTDGLVEQIGFVSLPREHYAGASLWRFAAGHRDALKVLLSAPPTKRKLREAIFRQFDSVILADAELTVLALNNGWVPSARRERVLERLASDEATDPLELLSLIADDHPVVPRALDALASTSRLGVSSERALRIIREVGRFSESTVVVDAVLEGVSVGGDEAEFTRQASVEHGRVVGDLVARRLLARSAAMPEVYAWPALFALRDLRLDPAHRAALMPVALRLAEGEPNSVCLHMLLEIPDLPRWDSTRLAMRCVQAVSESGQRSLGPIRTLVAGHSGVERAVLAEARRLAPTSRNSAFILDVLELPSSGELDEALVLQALNHTADPETLDRLLALVTPGTPIHRTVADRVAELHPSHPVAGWCRAADVAARQRIRSAERAKTITTLSAASPVQRLAAMLAGQQNVNYWPQEWADVDVATIEALTADDRAQLARRAERGAPVWRELARRLRGSGGFQ